MGGSVLEFKMQNGRWSALHCYILPSALERGLVGSRSSSMITTVTFAIDVMIVAVFSASMSFVLLLLLSLYHGYHY